MKYLALLLLAGCAAQAQVCPAPPVRPVQSLDVWAVNRKTALEAQGRAKPKDKALWGRIGESREYTKKILETR